MRMPERRVIYDSEDEDGDEGFSLPNSPSKALFTESGDHDGDNNDDGEMTLPTDNGDNTVVGSISDARSTDPEFFRQLYESAQKTPVTDAIVPDSAAQQDVQDDNAHTSSSIRQKASSSITDPASTRTKRKTMGQIRAQSRRLLDCTPVTTPTAPISGQKDIYDFTLSDGDEEDPSVRRVPANIFAARKMPEVETVKKNKKRRPALLEDAILDSSSPQLPQAPGAADDKWNSKIEDKGRQTLWLENQSQIPDDVDLLRFTPASSGLAVDASLQAASKEPSSASFIIAPPSRLTASQKQEYLRLSDISEADRESHYEQPSLPPQKPLSGDCLPSSTNTHSTVEGRHSSRHRSSAGRLPTLNSFGEVITSCATETQPEAPQPPSSPDILNADLQVTCSRKLKRKRCADAGESRVVDGGWDSDSIGVSREQYVPRPSRRRTGLESIAHGSNQEEAKADAPISRARREKQRDTVGTGQDFDSESEKVHRSSKRAVARHKTSRRSSVIGEDEDKDQQDSQSMPDTLPPDSFELGNESATEPPLASSQHEAREASTAGLEGLDRDFLAALPEEIRQEVIADHIAQQSARESQATRTRSHRRFVERSSEHQSLPITTTPQPRKRGRKKKQQQASHDEQPAAPASEAIPVSESSVTGKRRRGRPRKSDVAQVTGAAADADVLVEATTTSTTAQKIAPGSGASAEDDVMEALAGDSETFGNAELELVAPAKRGRKRKIEDTDPTTRATPPEEAEDPQHSAKVGSEAMDAATERTDAVDQRDILKDISNSAVQNGSSGSLEGVDEDGGKQQQEQDQTPTTITTVKTTPGGGPLTAGGSSSSTKTPLLRVGLSKKSRIAPLLKMIRK
ncbi:hypothetical protein BD289DRAFT_257825 [Coniella lustricola]|uniref:Uncharacterized protein n=1 Tax=Coniella lustricola TaxID=2025994 RepID=A0A2T3A812_9PEZI|nr:hypothetical protein BD289DRAFT_257825 [Coniella lustricola]